MSLTVFFFLVCFALGVQSTAVKQYQDEVEGHEGQCRDRNEKFYKLGEVINDEPCVRKVCRGTAAPGSVYVEVERCEKAKDKTECKLTKGAKNNYPDCCSKLECK